MDRDPDLLDIKARMIGGYLYQYGYIRAFKGKWGAVPDDMLNSAAGMSWGVFDTKEEAFNMLIRIMEERSHLCAG